MLLLSIGYPVIRKGSGDNNTVMVDIGGNACLDSGLMIICDIIIGENAIRTWYRDGQQLTERGRKLTLSADDRGTNYTCVATNQCGSDRATTIVSSKSISHIFIVM